MDKELQKKIAGNVADELAALLKHGWSEMLWDQIETLAPNASDEEKEAIAMSISWTLIDTETGEDLLGANK